MRVYCPDPSPVSGYGRLAVACTQALDAFRVPRENSPDLALCDPADPSPAPFRFTMWESTALPPTTHFAWKQAKVLIVPSKFCQKLFRSVTRKPVEVCELYGAATYTHLPVTKPFRFLCVARDNGTPSRKGIDQLIQWFTEAFPTQSDVSLTIKQSAHCKKRYTYDRRIHIIYEDFEAQKYNGLLAAHHCGIFLSGAEAWNFPLCELMATGRPSICIPFGGPADFTSRSTSWHIPYKLVTAPREVYQSVGQVAFPDKRGTIQAMREAYSDQILLAEKAAASARMSQEYTETRFAARLRHIVAKYG